MSTSIALSVVVGKYFDVLKEANYSIFTQFLYYAKLCPEEKAELKFLNEIEESKYH